MPTYNSLLGYVTLEARTREEALNQICACLDELQLQSDIIVTDYPELENIEENKSK